MQLRIDLGDHFSQMLWVVNEVDVVHIKDDEVALVVLIDPGFVALVESA